MNRVLWFIICALVGIELIAWGLLVPVHLRTVDARAVQLTGSASPSLADEGISLVNLEKTGPARMLLKAAEQIQAPGRERLGLALDQFEGAHPKLKVWGGAAPYLERIFEKIPPITNWQSQPIIDLIVSPKARETLMEALRDTRRPGVLEILQTRNLTNTVVLPPAKSAAGQPLDATIAVMALLFQQDHFAPAVRDAIGSLVATANRGGAAQPLEAVYVDLLSLGKRLNWGQFVDLVRMVPDLHALQETARLFREREAQLPIIYSAMHVAESPRLVIGYLTKFPRTGMADLSFGLRSGTGAIRDLLERQQAIHYPHWRDQFVEFGPIRVAYEPLAHIASQQPLIGYCIKYGLCLLGALLLARAVTYLSPSLTDEIVTTKPFITGPQVAIALCLLS
jgi:hypothetical protein